MQINFDVVGVEKEVVNTIVLEQPYASNVLSNAVDKRNAVVVEKKPALLGRVLVCASDSTEVYGLQSGVTLGYAEIEKIENVQFTSDEDLERVGLKRGKLKKGSYVVYLKNIAQVTELPFTGKVGIYESVFIKDSIVEYPESLAFSRSDIALAVKINK